MCAQCEMILLGAFGPAPPYSLNANRNLMVNVGNGLLIRLDGRASPWPVWVTKFGTGLGVVSMCIRS